MHKLYLQHTGTPQMFDFDPNGSGRYRQGSGENPYQHGLNFFQKVDQIKRENPGISRTKIAELMGYSTTEWRDKVAYYNELRKCHDRSAAVRMRNDRQMSVEAIAKNLGISQNTVREYLKDSNDVKNKEIQNIMDSLQESLKKYPYIDIGEGTAGVMGVSDERLRAAVQALVDEYGYVKSPIQVDQINPRQYKQKTDMLILGPPGKTPHEQAVDVYKNLGDVHYINEYYSEDNGLTMGHLRPPVSVDSKRIEISYADKDGFQPLDGVIELRPGAADLDLGPGQVYSQVRIAVDDAYYLKGIAVYADDLPEGVDIRVNSNKPEGTPKEKVFKAMKRTKQLPDGSDDPNSPIDKDNPFGATIQAGGQRDYTDKDGTKKQSAINKVYQEGTWEGWRKGLASQFLSKQSKELAKSQLNITYLKKQEEFDAIKDITLPAIRKKILFDFADSCEEDAADLKAWSMPGQSNKVLLPVVSMEKGECYCPSYPDNTTLVCIRYPHSGPQEILQVKVNNKNKEARKRYGTTPRDLIGINPSEAAKLSGADFDGDFVVVIPNNKGRINVKKMLKEMEGFDPKVSYKGGPGLKRMTDKTKGLEMGKAANLISDMTLIGCDDNELARAQKYSMVVIDAQKHGLDWKQAAKDYDIAGLRKKYQGTSQGGASTIISRSKGPVWVPEKRLVTSIDPNTGDKIEYETGNVKWIPKQNKDGTLEWKQQPVTVKTKKMYTTGDAYDLVSDRNNPYPMEVIYADYANQMKDMARQARLEAINIKKEKKSPTAANAYAEEVASLEKKLKARASYQPADRLALRIATVKVNAIKEENPNITKDQLKKKSAQALSTARTRVYETGKKEKINITPNEWEAIQAKAISDTMLEKLLRFGDSDQIRDYATPKKEKGNMFSAAQISRMKAYRANDYTWAEIAEEFGVSESTIKRYIDQ